MLWQRDWLLRAWWAVGVLGAFLILLYSPARAQAAVPDDPERIAAPENANTKTVDLLSASKVGELGVVARGQGQDRVRLTIRNPSSNRLRVILPAGLVASAAAGQGRGLQSMGLGMVP